MERERLIYYKELAHLIMETEKSPHSAICKLENQESQWYKFLSKSQQEETQEEPMFQLKSKGRRKLMFHSNSQVGGVPFYSWEGQPFCSSQAFK